MTRGTGKNINLLTLGTNDRSRSKCFDPGQIFHLDGLGSFNKYTKGQKHTNNLPVGVIKLSTVRYTSICFSERYL